jgi:beta-glucosidase
LKNDNNLLPLKKGTKVLLCGPAANSLNIINGAWTHTWQGVDTNFNTKGASTIYQAMQEINPGQVSYVLGSDLDKEVNIAAAVSAARSNDVVVVCLGEMPSTEKPGDIEDLNLPKAQQNLVHELSKTGKPIILVFAFNRPMIVREIEPLSSAIVHAYLPGDFGGIALSQILFGDVNPSGKLPFTYPRNTGSLLFYDHKHTELLDKDFGYNTFNPQWEFGFGLSYSKFVYSNLKIDKKSFGQSDMVRISVQVKNDSDRPAKEVVQVFVSDLVASITPSVKRLRAFRKVSLEAGETKTIEIEMPIAALAFVNKDLNWIVEPGEFLLQVNALKQKFNVKD